MDKFFHPHSIAVIGASKKDLGHHLLTNIIDGFEGQIYPVNRNYAEIAGLPCYPSVEGIPHTVDLAIIIVPAASVPSVLRSCARKGIPRVIIESAGFAEAGERGITLQQECINIAKEGNIRLWGPNCMGLVDVHQRHFFTFMHPAIRAEGLLPGRISLIVQSGMMSAIFLVELARRGIGVAKACSIGNRADVDECDLLAYLLKDPDTDVIALYLESVRRGRRLAELAHKAEKPIVLLKGGTSPAGAQAAKSHTYSLSGNDRLLKGVLDLSGVIFADDIYQMMDIAHTLATAPRISPACRTAILTMSGGAGVLACDAIQRYGIPVADLSERTKQTLAEVFPEWMPVANPIDLFPAVGLRGREVAFERTTTAVLQDPNVDILLVHFVAGLGDEVMRLDALQKRAQENGKAVFFWLMGRREGSERFRERARKLGIPFHADISRLAECLKALSHYLKEQVDVDRGRTKLIADIELTTPTMPPLSKEQIWDEAVSKRFLASWGIPVVEEKIITDVKEAWEAAEELGLPVVLKGLSPAYLHKSEHGLVRLGIADRAALEAAFIDIKDKVGEQGRIVIQKQIKGDYELIAGFIRDPQFGPCVMFGLGGVLAEFVPDVAFAMAPLGGEVAKRLIHRIRSHHLFKGIRGIPPLDEAAICDCLVKIGTVGAIYPEIDQIDINPFVVCRGKPVAVDANIILSEK